MATILNDVEIQKLLGTVIVDGDPTCIRPNSYVLRLGGAGEFLNTSKEFAIGEKEKRRGLKIQPGHAVGVIAFETLDFRRSTVHKIFPNRDLFGIVSPTTDLSREGIIAPTTQVDAGFHGTLNWTLTNSSNEERKFIYKERIYRITLFRLEEGESPERLYTGDYQSQTGYVRSRRSGAPVGLREADWEDPFVKGGPEDLLENLLKSGYPWHILGQRLMAIDKQFKAVSEEYGEIHDTLKGLESKVDDVVQKGTKTPLEIEHIRTDIAEMKGQLREANQLGSQFSDKVRSVFREEASSLQNRWAISSGSVLVGLLGVTLAIASNPAIRSVVFEWGTSIAVVLVLAVAAVQFWVVRQK